MKRYKLINGKGYYGYEEGKIYDEGYCPMLGCYIVKEIVKYFPQDWEEVTEELVN